MLTRRLIFALIVIAGILVLILGIAGVFSPKRERSASPSTDKSKTPMKVTITGFETVGENWTLRAAEAQGEQGKGMQLTNPMLELRGAGSDAEQRLIIRSRKAAVSAIEEDAADQAPMHIRMSDNVEAEFRGEDKALLTTDSLEIDRRSRSGRTDSPVKLVAHTAEGEQVLSGTGAEFVLKQRLVTVRQDIEMEFTGAGSDIFTKPDVASPRAAPAKSGQVTRVSCKGPALADGFRNTVELRNDVVVKQGENELRADRLEVQFVSGSRTPQRFVAEGRVRFKAAGAEGTCDRLVRTAQDEQLMIEGNPSVIRQELSEIQALRIELSPQKKTVTVPAAGVLKIAPSDAKAGDPPMTVKWSRMLRFDPAEHLAVFRGDVRLTRDQQTIECQLLSVKFDADNHQIIECRAETDVRLSGPVTTGADKPDAKAEPVKAEGKELVYDPRKESLILAGAPARVERGGQVISGERIDVRAKDSAMNVAGEGTLENRASAGADSESFSISWTGDMRFNQSSQQAIFRRGVALKRAGDTLRAGHLVVKVGSDNTLKGLEATDNVSLTQSDTDGKGSRTLKANKIVADVGPDNSLRSFEATDNVSLTQADAAGKASHTLTAKKVVAAMGPGNTLQGFEATDNVLFAQADAGGKGSRVLKANKVVAEMGPGNALQGFEATGAVSIAQTNAAGKENLALKADRMVAKIGPGNQLKELTATGHAAVEEESKTTSIRRSLTADRIQSRMAEDGLTQNLEAAGGVTLKESDPKAAAGERVMKADKVTAQVGADNTLETFVATGRRVTLEEEGRSARGLRLVWDARKDAGQLFGSPAEIRQGQSRLLGTRIDFSQKGGAVKVTGADRVEATIVGGQAGAGIPLP